MQRGFVQFQLLFVLAVAVLVGAYYVGTTASKLPQLNISLTPPLPPEVPSTDEAKNWKTYTNKQYGYSFKYPSHWKLDTSESSIIEHSDTEGPTLPEFYITVFSNQEQETPYGAYNFDGLASSIVYLKKFPKIGDKIMLEKPSSIEPEGIYTSRLDDITVGGKPTMVFEGNSPHSIAQDRRLFVTHKDIVYMIGAYYVPQDGSIIIDNFNQILSTFRFD